MFDPKRAMQGRSMARSLGILAENYLKVEEAATAVLDAELEDRERAKRELVFRESMLYLLLKTFLEREGALQAPRNRSRGHG